MEIKKGIPVSPGYSIQRAVVLDHVRYTIPKRRIKPEELQAGLDRYQNAVERTRADIQELKTLAAKTMGAEQSMIFDAHSMMLGDKALYDQIIKFMREQLVTPEYAVDFTFRKYIKDLLSIGNPFFSQRVADMEDILKRLIKNLTGERLQEIGQLEQTVNIVAKELTPSQTATLDRDKVLGFATDAGGRTAHVAIMARTLGIPAVVGLGDISTKASTGDTVIIDGISGIVIISPDEETIKRYRILQRDYQQRAAKLDELRELAAETKDGHKIELLANLEIPGEVDRAMRNGAEGIGLFRTEFLYASARPVPDEELHYKAYSEMLKKLGSRKVVIRTLDLGGDKFFEDIRTQKEMNPFLGARSIRLCFERMDLFIAQLRAIFRAAIHGKPEILIPFISSLAEVKRTKTIIDDVKADLAKEELKYNPDVPFGIMIEIPSAVLTADQLADHVDFFSIGSNDLTQYTLAVDRVNERVAQYYQAAHPAILRMFKQMIDISKKKKKRLSLCGEMGGESLYSPLLVGLGFTTLSVSPSSIPEVKKAIRSITLRKAQEIARKCLKMCEEQEINKYLRSEARALGIAQDSISIR